MYDDSVLSRMFYRSLFVIWLYEVQGWKLYYRYVWRDSDSNFRYKFQRNFMDTDLKGIIIEFMERFELKEKVNDVQNANFSRCLMIIPLHCLWAIYKFEANNMNLKTMKYKNKYTVYIIRCYPFSFQDKLFLWVPATRLMCPHLSSTSIQRM